jgi:hypothetical protein
MSVHFDGDAVSQADRDFLASLADHPLTRHPLYGTPCPPMPDFTQLRPEENREAIEQAAFAGAVDWLLVNFAYREGAFMGKGGVVSLVDGEVFTFADLRGRMAPWEIMEVGPRGGIKMRSPATDWRSSTARLSIRREETRPDKPRPTFVEDGYSIFNRYRPPVHPIAGGDLTAFDSFFARLVPDDAERAWLRHWLAHKARRPWVPMVGVIMMAAEFGTGRGTLFDILELVFGEDYVVPVAFGELTGTSSGARFNARLADALFAVVNEAVAEDGHQQSQRRLHYDALKNAVDPSPTARQRFEQKGQHVYSQRSARSTIIATNHRDVVKLPRDDRRFEVITCGSRMTPEQTTEIRAWMAIPENIGALHRALLTTPAAPLEVFDPFDQPPPFAGRLEMIEMAKSRMEDAFEETIKVLEGFALFTMTQAQRLVGYHGSYASGDWSNLAMHTIAKNAFRLRKARVRHRNRKEIIYACTEAERQRWISADKAMIVAALERTEAHVVRVVNTGHTDPLAQLRDHTVTTQNPPDEENDD